MEEGHCFSLCSTGAFRVDDDDDDDDDYDVYLSYCVEFIILRY